MKKYRYLFTLFIVILAEANAQDFDSVYTQAMESSDIVLAGRANELAGSSEQKAKAHYLIGYLNHENRNYFEALSNYFSSLSYYREQNNYKVQSYLLENIGMVYEKANFYDEAADFFMQSKILRTSVNDTTGRLHTEYYLAKIYRKSSNFDDALFILEDLLEKHRERDNSREIAKIHNEIGLVHLANGEYEKARQYYNRALQSDLTDQSGSRFVKSYNNIGHSYLRQSDYRNALKYFNRALERYHGDVTGLDKVDNALLFQNLGKVYDSLKSDSAVYFYEMSYGLNAFDETKEEYLDLCIQIKNAYWKKNDMARARYFSDQVDKIASSVYSLKQNLNQLYVRYQVEAATYKMERELKTSQLEAQLRQDFIIKCVLAVILLVLVLLVILVYRKNQRLRFISSEAVRVYKVLNS